MAKRTPNPDSLFAGHLEEFYCGSEWHLASCSQAACLIYPWALRISKKSRRFRISPKQAAEYFKISPRTAQRGYSDLKRVGLFELLESGKAQGESSVYKPLTHKEWAVKYPGKCAEKITFAWTPENDLLGQFCSDDETTIKYFRVWYPEHKKEKEATGATGRHARRWRKYVAYNFAESLQALAGILEKHPSERNLILENLFAGRVPLTGHLEPANRESAHV